MLELSETLTLCRVHFLSSLQHLLGKQSGYYGVMVRIKICGITNIEDGLEAARLGADALGFVFAPSPRRISSDRAARIIKELPLFVTTVGLFVNEKKAEVREITESCNLDALQFHGNESPEYCDKFKAKKIIKAFRIKNEESLKNLALYDVDGYLLDSYRKESYGGTGTSFDWDLVIMAKGYGKPIIMAGGLSPDNIAQAIRKVKPYGVDVSTGVEKAPGKKDFELMRKFIQEVRSNEAQTQPSMQDFTR